MVGGLEPLPLAGLAQEAHARGLVVGAAVHGFNRWQWAEADFTVDGVSVHVPVDALSVRYGDGAAAKKRVLATTPNHYRVLDRSAVSFPPTRNNNAMVGYNSAVGTIAELAIDATSGKVAVLTHHTILECGNMLVPELVSGQLQGGVAWVSASLCMKSCRFTRMVRATAPGISIASLIGHSGSSAFRPTTTTAVSMSLTGSCFSSESAPGPSIMGVEDEAEQSTERPCCNERQVQAIERTHLIHRPARDIIPPQGGARVSSYRR